MKNLGYTNVELQPLKYSDLVRNPAPLKFCLACTETTIIPGIAGKDYSNSNKYFSEVECTGVRFVTNFANYIM